MNTDQLIGMECKLLRYGCHDCGAVYVDAEYPRCHPYDPAVTRVVWCAEGHVTQVVTMLEDWERHLEEVGEA